MKHTKRKKHACLVKARRMTGLHSGSAIAALRGMRKILSPDKVFPILDEFSYYAGTESMRNLLKMTRIESTRKMLACQAVMFFNSGKRTRFIGSVRWEDTGLPVMARPRKFLPSQVLRRGA